ncbi:hypothetical protein BLNAU_13300 [Blattamonas nauphoetae]|uniref:Uncharacterized protein n=1 Tax=Blattamonas nauphoetae TaxID=2049346 RepID=A0ABQ9XMG6_9EUKA|nr:hypothetical protein BLNAU_13300 [Blattamonas nauphoetae]
MAVRCAEQHAVDDLMVSGRGEVWMVGVSVIISNIECSPFTVRGNLDGHGCQIQIIQSSHQSTSNLVLPLVGTSHNRRGIDIGIQMMNDGAADDESRQGVSISGVGPLFSFNTRRTLNCGMDMETSLLDSTLVNVSSSSDSSPSKQLFGSEVCQRMVGSCVSCCTNHDSGTGMMSPNMGGNLVCLNTSFSSCIRQLNEAKDFSFENRTQGDRLQTVTADVTSVSFTLCTFNSMTVSGSGWSGGAAVYLLNPSSSLTIKTCFFHKCSCKAQEDDGGAVYFECSETNRHPFSVSDSSFTECSAYNVTTSKNCGGSLSILNTSSISIDRCFFENSTAVYDGAMLLVSNAITISNSAFVECSSSDRAGGITIWSVTTLSLSFLKFRGCFSTGYNPNGKDIYFSNNSSIQITHDLIKFCDSTSGAPNVYFEIVARSDDTLVPQIDSTPTIKSVDVSFDEDDSEATVTIETEEAIKGTMHVLLDGSTVPRLVHVVFGQPSKVSTVGTVVVSSGAKGVLPVATYEHRKNAFASSLFPPPTVRKADSKLKDWNTTEIVLRGVSLEEGAYSMLVEKDGTEWSITLTRSNSTTLIGTAPLHPSTAVERLEWSTEYEVTKVTWMHLGEPTEEEVMLSNTIAFTTPDAPIRITLASCSLGGDQQKSALVTLTGVKLGGNMDYNLTVRKMEGSTPSGNPIVLSGTLSGGSSSISHSLSVVIFGNPDALISFGTKYLITLFEVVGSVLVVDSDVTFSVPAEPARLTTLDDSLQYSSDEKNATISLSGIGMEGYYNLTLSVNSSTSNNVTLLASFDEDGSGTVTAVLFDLSDPPIVDLSYNTRYEVVDVTQESNPVFFENGLVFTTIPVPSRLLSISVGDSAFGIDFVELSFSSVALPSEATFSLTLESVHSDGTTRHQKVVILETDQSRELTEHQAQLYPFETEAEKKKGQLKYDTKYKVVSFKSGDTTIHFEDSSTRIQTPMEPARIVRLDKRQLNSDRTSMIVWLKGRALVTRTGKVSLSNESSNWESSSDVVLVNNTLCTAEFAVGKEETSSLMKYGSSYTLKGIWTESSGFHVEDGITVVVPLPPKIKHIEFIFSNTLHTGCFVKLTGTDLIVGESLKITLNDSLSFIATVTSPTEAKSAELQIGWQTTLQHDTTYEITSIEAMNEDDGKTLFDPSISNTTGSPVRPFVIYVDSGSSSDSSLFCGDFDRPCSSIEVGWKIVEGIGLSSVSISIIHNTTLKEQIKLLSQHDVVIESGPSTKPELFVSPSSLSEMEGEGMVEVSGGRLWIPQVDVVVSDSPSLIFIRMIGGQLTMETCSLTGMSSSSAPNELEARAGLCLWESGILMLVNSKTIIKQTDLSHLSQGAINMKGGNLTIRTSSFDSNSPNFSSSPSLRHNIHCSEGGGIEVGSLSGGDGSSDTHPHLWLSSSECSLSGEDVNTNAPFFIPTLSSSSTSKLNKTSQTFDLRMEGTTLIPCSLFLEVFEKQKDGKEGKTIRIGLSEDSTDSFNETQIEMSLPVSSMVGFEKRLEWCGRVVYGLDETTTSFIIQKNSVDRAAQAARENMKWLIPLVVSLVCLLILIVIVVIICWRRKQKNQKTGKGINAKELDEEEATGMEVDQKMEETLPDKSIDHLISVKPTQPPNHTSDPTLTSAPTQHHFLEVLGESGQVEMVDWMKADTLFEVLHRPEKKKVIDKKGLSRQMTKGLIRVLGDYKTSGITTRFSPHWVLLTNNVVQLRLATISEGLEEGEQGTQNETQQDKKKVKQEESFSGKALGCEGRDS